MLRDQLEFSNLLLRLPIISTKIIFVLEKVKGMLKISENANYLVLKFISFYQNSDGQKNSSSSERVQKYIDREVGLEIELKFESLTKN